MKTRSGRRSRPPPYALWAGVASIAALVVVLWRGFLTLVADAYTILCFWTLPLTLESSAWYFGRSATALSVLVAMATFGAGS